MAGTVGGILANSTRPAEFIYDNMMIHATVVHAAHLFAVKRLLYLGSSCIYPRDCPQPMKEEHLLSGLLEPTNEAYAIAKIAGIKLCQAYRTQYGCDFISAMPTNLYGPNDNFDLTSSHVLPALIRKFHDAKLEGRGEVAIWGTGSPRREFLHVDDLADACVFLMQRYDEAEHINVGTGEDLTIRELAELVRDIVHPQAELVFDPTKPDGTPRKLLDVSRLHALGWRHRIELARGHRLLLPLVPREPRDRPRSREGRGGLSTPPRASDLMAVLVTGGAGYIGSAFVERLVAAGENGRRARRPVARP